MPKKGKKKKVSAVELQKISTQEILPEEEEEEEVIYTDTSYSSASFEDLSELLSFTSTSSLHKHQVKHRKKKKPARRISEKDEPVEELEFKWSDDADFDLTIGAGALSCLFLPEPEEPPPVVEVQKEKKTKKKKDKKVVEEIPEFEKPKAWKSMSKQERMKWQEERVEEWRHEMEAQRMELLANIKAKRKALAVKREALMQSNMEEMEVRKKMLSIIFHHFRKFQRLKTRSKSALIEKQEWERFLRCDGTPNPHMPIELHQYLHAWRMESDRFKPDNVAKKLNIVLPILDKINKIIPNTRRFTPSEIESFKEMQADYRRELVITIQMVAYYLLRDIEHNLQIEDSILMTYHREFENLKLNLWVAFKKLSYHTKKTKEEDEPLQVTFPEIKVKITLPLSFGRNNFCIRGAHFALDLLSEFSRTSPLPAYMPDRFLDLLELNMLEQEETIKLKEKFDSIREEFYKEAKKRIKEIQQMMKANPFLKHDEEKEEMETLMLAEPPQLRDPYAENPRLLVMENYERAHRKYLEIMKIRLRIGEVNLRKYRIINGMLNLDVLVIPPQPKRVPYEATITTVIPPCSLHDVPYHVRYRLPEPREVEVENGPIKSSAEIREQQEIIRENLEKLVHIEFELPSNLMFFESPIICQWHAAKMMWTTVYITDYHYDEETRTVDFRTGILWPISTAYSRYVNYPIIGWEIRPELGGTGVFIIIEGVYIKLTWLVRGFKVSLLQVDKFPEHTLEDLIGKPMTIINMRTALQARGCDFFPEYDGYLYVEQSCPKVWPLERHTYHAMALMSRSYNFQMSRWNSQAGYRDIIIQMREMYSLRHVFKLDLLRVTPRRATILHYREETMPLNEEGLHEFCNQAMLNMKFSPDLFSLSVKFGSLDVKRIIFNMGYELTETVYEMLTALRLCSYG